MFSFMQTAAFLGGSFAFSILMLLPLVTLLAISIVYIVFDVIQNFRDRRGSL